MTYKPRPPPPCLLFCIPPRMSGTAPVPVATTLSNVVFFLTVPLEYAGVADDRTLARLRAALATNFEQHFAPTTTSERGEEREMRLELAAGVMPPKPLLNACFAVRMRWSDWFAALSPGGTPLVLAVRDDRADTPRALRRAPPSTLLRPTPNHPQQTHRPRSPSLGRSSSCSSMRSDVPSLVSSSSLSTAPESCPPSPPPAMAMALGTAAGERRPRRQRGGVKQKQRGIHIDKSRLDVTPYDGGVTGVLTGGVMLGRRSRPAIAIV